MTTKFTRFAVAAGVAGALIVPATSAQAASQTERALLGAVLGGVAGAALGHGDGDAVAVGAVAGAALGAVTKDNNHRRHYSRSYRTTRPYAYDNRYQYNTRSYGNQYDSRYGRAYDPRSRYGYGSGYSNGYYDSYGAYRR
jgi:uncharacterized protein YcfJ